MSEDITYAQKQAVLVGIRRKVLAAMETGAHDTARTLVTELADYDLAESRKLRADIVSSYGIAF